jgi:hypothetical protein
MRSDPSWDCKRPVVPELSVASENPGKKFRIDKRNKIGLKGSTTTIIATMLTEGFITSIRSQPTKTGNSAIAKDVGIHVHTLNPSHTVKSTFKKSSTAPNNLAATSTHVFAAQVDKAIVHIYSKEKSNQESLVSFPERVHSLAAVGDNVIVVGTAEGRLILWDVSVENTPFSFFD